MKKFSKQAQAFLVTKFFVYAQSAFFKLFINIYFWRITEDIAFLVLYNVIFEIAHALTYIPAGKINKELSRVLPLRIGICLQLIFFITILLLGEDIVTYIIPVALMGGIGNGAYWSSDNLLKFDLTNTKNRLNFTTTMHILSNIAHAILPLVASLMVASHESALDGYGQIFFIAAILTVMPLFFSSFISSKEKWASTNYQPWRMAKRLLQNRNIRFICISGILGNIASVLTVLIPLLLFFSSGTEISIGSYQLITVTLAIGAYYLLGRFFSKKDYRWLMISGSVLSFSTVFILLISQTYTAILLYGVLGALFSVISAPAYPIVLDTLSHFCKTKKERFSTRSEYMTLIELCSGIGKIIGFCILLLLSYSLSFMSIAIVCLLLAIFGLMSGLILAWAIPSSHAI